MVRMETVRLILAIAAAEDMELLHFDVKTAFLYGSLEEEIYMQQPEGYIVENERKVCELTKSLYGLKQAPRMWNKCFTNFLHKFNLRPLKKDTCVFVNSVSEEPATLIIAIYVDDGLICCKDVGLLSDVINHMKTGFQITIMGLNCFVGLEISRDRPSRKIKVNQQAYVKKIVNRFELNEAKEMTTPMEAGKTLCKEGVNE